MRPLQHDPERKYKMAQMVTEHKTYQEIADKFGISKQRVEQILHCRIKTPKQKKRD